MAASWQLFHFLEDIISYLIIKEMVVIKQIAVASIERLLFSPRQDWDISLCLLEF